MKQSKIKRWAKRIGFSLIAILLILTAVLAVHIYQVTNRPKGGVDGWQLARIDFKETLDSNQVAQVRNTVHQLSGIKHSFYNTKDDILVYAFDPKEQQSALVYEVVKKETGLKAERFIVSDADMANGCPVIDQNSVTYRISSGFQKLFKSNNH